MALIDKASLLMVPSTYEDGTLYNVLPSGNKAPDETGSHNGYDQTRADFTFSRGSNLAATRVNADGLIEKGRENLLTESNNFSDSDWSKGSVSVTSGQSDKDGGTSAFLIQATSTFANISQGKSQSGVQTYSVYAKAGTTDWFVVYAICPSTDPQVFFNLGSGTIGAEGSNIIDANIEDVGNGWYRCSITYNESITSARFYVVDGNNSFAVTTGANIYIQNAQLESGLVASSYLDSGATTATAGVLENTPRIDYSSGAGALLLEPGRTNKIGHSEYINNSVSWVEQNGADCTPNYALSPEGVKNATRVQLDNSGANSLTRIFHDFTPDSSNDVATFYAKSNTGSSFDIVVYFRDSGFGTTRGTKTITLTNDWQRFELSADCSGASGNVMFLLYNTTSDQNWDFLMYGAQVEAGSYASSYIPTYGSAASRSADSCSVTGVSDVIGQSEGVVYFELEYHDNNETAQIFEVHGTAGTTRIFLQASSSNQLRAAIIANNGYDFTTGSDYLVEGNTYKIAFAYKSGDYALYVNGSSVNTSAGTYTPNETISVARFAQTSGGFNREKINAKNLTLFKERLSNSELADLTS